MTVIVDYNAGNLTSVKTALRHIDAVFEVSSDPQVIEKADKIIFPGVGEAGQAMGFLRRYGISEALKNYVSRGNPLLGICLGAQILQDYSEESDTELLGIIPGNVCRFPDDKGLKIPLIGWNTVSHNRCSLFSGIAEGSSFYFVHSYCISTRLPDNSPSPWVCATSEYGIRFAAALQRENVWGTQFHPEKSGAKGLLLLRNFIEKVG